MHFKRAQFIWNGEIALYNTRNVGTSLEPPVHTTQRHNKRRICHSNTHRKFLEDERKRWHTCV
jgi:hypothetical protein